MNKALVITKLNFRRLIVAYIITAVAFMAQASSNIAQLIDSDVQSGGNLSTGNLVALLPLLAAFFIPSYLLTKTMHLGARRTDIFWGAVPVYVLIALGTAGFMVAFHLFIDPLIFQGLVSKGEWIVLDMPTAFGFYHQGAFGAFIQLSAFLLLVECFIHTLTMAQTRWYGWVADVIIVAIISVFTPIAVLRSAEVWFFRLIIFGTPWLQVVACLVLATGFYALSMPLLNSVKL